MSSHNYDGGGCLEISSSEHDAKADKAERGMIDSGF